MLTLNVTKQTPLNSRVFNNNTNPVEDTSLSLPLYATAIINDNVDFLYHQSLGTLPSIILVTKPDDPTSQIRGKKTRRCGYHIRF